MSGSIHNIEYIHRCAIDGNISEITKLIENGSFDINTPLDKRGSTLVHLACIHGKLDLLKFAVGCGANVNLLDKNGNSPLEMLSRLDLVFVKLLYENGANIHKLDHELDNVIHNAMYENEDQIDLNSILFLIKHDVDINAKNLHDQTPLYLACKYNNTEAVKLLLNSGAIADDSITYHTDKSLLDIAKEHSNQDIINLIQDHLIPLVKCAID